jgi:RimJ/RimL family protein N-acetyltransferase
VEDLASFERPPVRLEPWGDGDAALLIKLNEPEMTRYVGGPETPRELADRQSRYEVPDSRQYKIVFGGAQEAVGWVGYWEREWREAVVWEIGWSVFPAFQGRGIATAATALAIDRARDERRHAAVHAFPMTTNAPSNTICRKLRFALLGEIDFPARRGGFERCNDWRLDLFDEDERQAGEASAGTT